MTSRSGSLHAEGDASSSVYIEAFVWSFRDVKTLKQLSKRVLLFAVVLLNTLRYVFSFAGVSFLRLESTFIGTEAVHC